MLLILEQSLNPIQTGGCGAFEASAKLKMYNFKTIKAITTNLATFPKI